MSTKTTNGTCKLCGGKPKVYRFKYIEGEWTGAIIEMCLHEYNARLTNGETLALVAGQEIPPYRFGK